MVRLSGAEPAVRAAAAAIGGETIDNAFWEGVREHSDGFFAGDEPLWRLSLPSTSPPLALEGRQLIEWNGGLRWLKSAMPARRVREATAPRRKGHATLFRAADKSAGCFAAA
jgi:glycolate oxidase FAD binding subunit